MRAGDRRAVRESDPKTMSANKRPHAPSNSYAIHPYHSISPSLSRVAAARVDRKRVMPSGGRRQVGVLRGVYAS